MGRAQANDTPSEELKINDQEGQFVEKDEESFVDYDTDFSDEGEQSAHFS